MRRDRHKRVLAADLMPQPETAEPAGLPRRVSDLVDPDDPAIGQITWALLRASSRGLDLEDEQVVLAAIEAGRAEHARRTT